jgi:4-hydroxybutyrate CoA-transferase
VAGLIEDGSTIEMGIGAIPSAVMNRLADRRELGIHSGMISDNIIDLVEAGAIPLSRAGKKNRIVVGDLVGTKRLFSFVHENPLFEMSTVDYTHNPMVIGKIPKFVAVNSALEVDLSGQVNSERINGLQIGGVGGALDFCAGASLSPGGKAIIALPSTAKKGDISRIVSKLSSGADVSIPRYYVDYVVTEYGIAHLSGRTMRERAEILIGIAHPKFRDGLDAQFRRNG